MPDPGLAAALKLLSPIVSAVRPHIARVQAERAAAGGGKGPQLLRHSLQPTLRRLQGGHIDDSWWQQLLDYVGHQTIAADWLKDPAVSAWFAEDAVGDTLLDLAEERLVGAGVSSEDAQRQAEASYIAYTEGDRAAARSAIATAVSVLVAGYLASIPKNQRSLAGLVQAALRRPPADPDPATQTAHTELAERELRSLLARRALAFVQPHREASALLSRVTTGDLAATRGPIKSSIQYWAVLFGAGEPDALDTAKRLRASLSSDVHANVAILDARIAEADGDSDSALHLLRDLDSADGRSALFGTLARVRDNRAALLWFEEQPKSGSPAFFTPLGWRNWAFAMAKEDQWEEAAERLAVLGPLRDTDPGLAQIEGAINAALLLPPDFRPRVFEDVPLYAGIDLHRTPEVGVHHARATECFDKLRSQLADVEHSGFSRYLELWCQWLRLMSPDVEAVQHVRAELARAMEDASRRVDLVPLAWAFRIKFDATPLVAWLNSRRELGGLTAEERVAEWISNYRTMSPTTFLGYLADHRTQLEEVVPTATLTILECEACIRTDQLERARSLVENAKNLIGKGEYELLLADIESAGGSDTLGRLETAYRNDESLRNLKALVAHLNKAGDFGRLRKWSVKLFERERTLQHAELVASAEEQRGLGASLEFLESIPDLVSARDDLRARKGEALFMRGRFREAKAINDLLLQRRKVWQDTQLDLYLALYMGEWERMAAVVDREWEDRDNHNARTLLQLGYLAAEGGANDERALSFARLAADRADDDPDILMGAYLVHVRLGHEDRVDPSWFARAAAHSSVGGPIQPVSLDALVRDVLPKRQAYLDEVTKGLASGRLPISVAASQFNVPLMSIINQAAEENSRIRDGRRRGILPIVSGSRELVPIPEDWSIGMDVTSVLVLKHLDLLAPTLNALGKVVLSPDIFVALFGERHMARFHQPSQIRNARELQDAYDSGHIQCLPDAVVSNSDLVLEVGPQLAALLMEARSRGGIVVCDRPIYKFESLLSREAAIDEVRDVLLSPLEFCEALGQSGKMADDEVGRARRLLPNRPWHTEGPRTNVLDGPVYLHGVALHRLQDARLLGGIATSGLSVLIHRQVLANCRRLRGTAALAEQLVGQVDQIRATLRAAIHAGTASLLPREHWQSGEVDSWVRAGDSTQSLLQGAARYDALCLDDRFFNAQGGLSDAAERVVPVLCILDVLRELRRRSAISQGDYVASLHKLRAAGFVFILPEEEEWYARWREAPLDGDEVVESAELGTVRQTMARVYAEGMCTPAEVLSLTRRAVETGTKAIRRLWTDSAVSVERAAALSDQLWRQLTEMPLAGLDGGASSVAMTRRGGLVLSMGPLLFPLVELSEERRAAYSRWFGRIVSTMRPGKDDVVREAVIDVWREVQSVEKYAEALGHIFLDQLPEELRDLAIADNRGFARECGFEKSRVLTMASGLQIRVEALIGGSRKAFRSGRPVRTCDLAGNSVEIVSLTAEAGVEVRWNEEEAPRSARLADLAVLASGARTRTRALRRLVARVGPTAAEAHELLAKVSTGPLSDEDAAGLLRESAIGFASIRRRCEQTVQGGRFRLDDIVPTSVLYFEDLAGPPPESFATEPYIRGTLVPYRKKLLRRDLRRGLELALLGSLRDDLCPGKWLTRYKNDRVWQALAKRGESSNPFVLLGVLDISLYRRDDPRFERLAAGVLTRLADPQLGYSDGIDRYRILAALSTLVRNRVALLPGCANRPNYWRRICALMQGGWLLEVLEPAGAMPHVEEFLEWLGSHLRIAGYYADAVGMREEPMLHAGVLTAESLRDEVFGRLEVMRARHKNQGREASWSDETRAAWQQIDAKVSNQMFGFPGPLEGERRPGREVPKGIVDAVHQACVEREEISLLRVLAVFSQGARLQRKDLEKAREAVREIGLGPPRDVGLREVNELNFASFTAVAGQDKTLADEVANVLVQLSRDMSKEEIVHQIVRLMVQTAAVNEEKETWSRWLESRLDDVAKALPGAPGEPLKAFRESLREMEIVLPYDESFHLRAQAVALSGAA